MSDLPQHESLPRRPPGRRSAILLLIAAAALLVWALTAGDDPSLRTAAVGGVVALTIVGIAIRFAHRAVREQRGEESAPAAAKDAAGGVPLPDSCQELLHQLEAAVRSASYLRSVLVPRLEEMLEDKQRGPNADRVGAQLRRLVADAGAPRWSLRWLLRSRRTTADALAVVARELSRLP